MNRIKKALIALVLAVALLIGTVIPVSAIVNPDSIDFIHPEVFYNVTETGDTLIVAEGQVNYAIEPTDYTASEAFIFELLNVAGNATIVATTLQAYGFRPISIYLSANQTIELGIGVGTQYILRISGNPAIFPSPIGNSVNKTLTAADYTDQLLGVDGGVASANDLRNLSMQMAQSMEDQDTPVDSYIVVVDGTRYLTTAGGNLFLQGIPGLNIMCPILFAIKTTPLVVDVPADTGGAYAANLTPALKWGNTTANGIEALADYVGIDADYGGAIILFALSAMLGMYIYKRTHVAAALPLVLVIAMFAGAFMGLMPLSIAFIFLIVIGALGIWYFVKGGPA